MKYSSSERMASVIVYSLSGPVEGDLRQSVALRRNCQVVGAITPRVIQVTKGVTYQPALSLPQLPRRICQKPSRINNGFSFFQPLTTDSPKRRGALPFQVAMTMVIMDFDNHDRVDDNCFKCGVAHIYPANRPDTHPDFQLAYFHLHFLLNERSAPRRNVVTHITMPGAYQNISQVALPAVFLDW